MILKLKKILIIMKETLLALLGFCILIFFILRIIYKNYFVFNFIDMTLLNCIFFFFLVCCHLLQILVQIYKIKKKNIQFNKENKDEKTVYYNILKLFNNVILGFRTLSFFLLNTNYIYAKMILNLLTQISIFYSKIITNDMKVFWLYFIILISKLTNIIFIFLDVFIFHHIFFVNIIPLINFFDFFSFLLLHSTNHALIIAKKHDIQETQEMINFKEFYEQLLNKKQHIYPYFTIIYSIIVILMILFIFYSLILSILYMIICFFF